MLRSILIFLLISPLYAFGASESILSNKGPFEKLYVNVLSREGITESDPRMKAALSKLERAAANDAAITSGQVANGLAKARFMDMVVRYAPWTAVVAGSYFLISRTLSIKNDGSQYSLNANQAFINTPNTPCPVNITRNINCLASNGAVTAYMVKDWPYEPGQLNPTGFAIYYYPRLGYWDNNVAPGEPVWFGVDSRELGSVRESVYQYNPNGVQSTVDASTFDPATSSNTAIRTAPSLSELTNSVTADDLANIAQEEISPELAEATRQLLADLAASDPSILPMPKTLQASDYTGVNVGDYFKTASFDSDFTEQPAADPASNPNANGLPTSSGTDPFRDDPNLSAPDIPDPPTMQQIMSNLRAHLDPLRSLDFGGLDGQCTPIHFDYVLFGHPQSFSTDVHCQLFEQFRALISTFSILVFTFVAVKIVLSA